MIRLATFLGLLGTAALAPAATTVGDPVASRSAEGRAHYEAGRYEEALRAYQDALVERPESAALHLNVGAAMYQLGDHENALEEFGRAAASDEVDVATRGFYNKGNTHFQLQDYKAAVDAYRQALERTPGDLDAKANLELALRLMQQPPTSQQGDSEDSDEDSEESEDSEQSQQGESEPSESEDQQPQDGQSDKQPEQSEAPEQSEQEPEQEPESSGQESDPDSAEDDANEDLAEQGDESETMDENEAEQLLDALNDRDEQSQNRRYRARRRGDDEQDW